MEQPTVKVEHGDVVGSDARPVETASAIKHETHEVKEEGPSTAAPRGVMKTEADDAANGSSAVKVEEPTDEAITAKLRSLLAEVDMDTTTEKSLRVTLETHFGCELKSRRKLIRDEVEAYLVSTSAPDDGAGQDAGPEGEEEEEEEAPAPKKRRGGAGFGSVFLSPPLREILGHESMPRTQVVKELWVYIRANNLQNPKDKRQILLDEKMGKVFKTPLTMFSMNKQLSRHLSSSADFAEARPEPEASSSGSEEEGARRPTPKGKAKGKRCRGSDDESEEEEVKAAPKKKPAAKRKPATPAGEGGAAPKGNGFTKQLPVSDALAAMIGRPTISRPELTKFMWAYFKEKNLQDPKDRSFIRSDDALFALTKRKRFKAFGMMKVLAQHLITPNSGGHASEEDEEEDSE